MTPVETRRARRYWWIALLVLPLLNPVMLVLVAWVFTDESLGFVAIAVWLGVANGLVLWRLADRAWSRPEQRRWRIGFGLAWAIALSFLYGFAELLVYLWIVCPSGGCFD